MIIQYAVNAAFFVLGFFLFKIALHAWRHWRSRRRAEVLRCPWNISFLVIDNAAPSWNQEWVPKVDTIKRRLSLIRDTVGPQ